MPARATEEEDGGEGYFASISDLMVGVLFVFLLMLTVFALNFHDAEQAQTVERARYEQKVRELAGAREEAARQQQQALIATAEAERERQEAQRQAEAAARKEAENTHLRDLLRRAATQLTRDIEDRAEARRRLLATVEQALQQRGVRVYLDQRSGILRLSGDLLFQTGSATLGNDARHTVQILADVLAQTLPCYVANDATGGCGTAEPVLETVLVEGHTDRQHFSGTDEAASLERNDRLSADRALSVFLELRHAAPALDALRNEDRLPLLGVSGYGERRPLADAVCDAAGNCPVNRRIDLRFVLSARSSDEMRRITDEIEHALGDAP